MHIVIGRQRQRQQLKLDKADSVDRKTSLQINSLPERGRCGQWAVEWAWLKWLGKPSEAHSTEGGEWQEGEIERETLSCRERQGKLEGVSSASEIATHARQQLLMAIV